MRNAVACICLLLTQPLFAQELLNNETIIKLTKAGVGEEIIVGMVSQQPGKYSLSADDVIALKKAGVSDKVLAALVLRNSGGSAQPTPSVAARLKSPGDSTPPPALPSDATSTAAPSSADGHTRVYVTDSQSWEMRRGWSAGELNGTSDNAGYQSGGARPQTAEIIKTFNQRCPEVTITNNIQKADFAVTLDRVGGKNIINHHNKIVVYNRGGDDIFSVSARELGNSVKDACEAIMSHRPWSGPHSAAALSAAVSDIFTNPSLLDVTFTSTPPSALVTISGQPIGRTPFITRLPRGIYRAVFSADGYTAVTKEVTVGPGYPTTVSTTLQGQ